MALRGVDGSSGTKGQQTKISGIMRTVDFWRALPKGFEGGFDAILNGDGPFSGNCYLFKGDSYLKFDWSSGSAVHGYPKKIAGNWPGMPSDFCHDIDAAVNGHGPFAGNCYFFKGDSYVKFDWKNDRAYSDCPKKVAGNWPGLSAGFEGDFDAAMNGNGSFAGNCYIFKGDSYLKFEWMKDHAASGYPKKIADGWHGLPKAFKNGLNASVEGFGPKSGKAFLFKGNDFISYDWASDRTD